MASGKSLVGLLGVSLVERADEAIGEGAQEVEALREQRGCGHHGALGPARWCAST